MKLQGKSPSAAIAARCWTCRIRRFRLAAHPFEMEPLRFHAATLSAAADTMDLELAAYHEAGHALMACLVGARVRSVTIDPDRDDGPARYGDTQIEWRVRGLSRQQFCQRAIRVALAGPVAEMLYTGDPFHPALIAEWSGDWRDAWSHAAELEPLESKRMRRLEQTAIKLHRELHGDLYWSALAAIADLLLAHETLEAEEVEEVVREWLGG